jgi:3-hydroxyisobutyrate dehydrogenase
MTKVGLIGTGMLGEAVGLHLLESGYDLNVYNRTKAKTKKLAENGATIFDLPKHMAESSDLIITCVKDADAVKEVLFGNDGITSGKYTDLSVADMSTINPTSAQEISKKLHTMKIKSLEIPVMGGPNVAINGGLVLMASGDKELFETHQKIFKTIANKIFFLGESGSAHTIKLAMNMQISLLALSLSEGIILMKKAGIEPEKFLEILNSTYFGTGMSEKKAYKMIKNEYEPTFTLKNLKKDLDIITKTAKDFDAVLPITERANKIYDDALAAGFGELDYTGVLAYIEKISRTKD